MHSRGFRGRKRTDARRFGRRANAVVVRLRSHPSAHAVAKKSERHRHQWLEGMMQPLHKRIHLRDRGLAKACGPAWQFHRTEIDCRRHKAPQWSIKCGVPRGVREDEKTAANDRAFIPKWDPPVERHCVHRTQPAHKRCRTTRSRASQVQAKPKSDSSNARRSLTCSCGSRRCTVQLFAGTDASDRGDACRHSRRS
jgi:hypothetical protein